MLEAVDPESAERLHENDVRRVSRAIEIDRLTGVTQTEHTRRDRERQGDFKEVIFALDWPREALYRRIDERVDAMISAGLADEVRALMVGGSLPTAAQAIGYKEIAAALRGETTLEAAAERVKQASRRYAKRQLSWLRRDPGLHWILWQKKPDLEKAASVSTQILEKSGIL